MKYKGSCNPFDKDFNWFLFFEQSAKEISLEVLTEAEKLASNWVSCACGQLCKALPRGVYDNPNEPKDPELSELGYNFHGEIEDARYFEKANDPEAVEYHLAKAKEILIKIEQRTTELLQNL
jgi:hypothetical protein